MISRKEFIKKVIKQKSTHHEIATALLWFYFKTKEYEERTPNELANDLTEDGFAKPHPTRLKEKFRSSNLTIRGNRNNTYKLNLRHISKLDSKYNELLNIEDIEIEDRIIPSDWVKSRPYLTELVKQINGTYKVGFYDCTAIIMRRLLETLIIEVYKVIGRESEIKTNNVFLPLEDLIKKISQDPDITLNRKSARTMKSVKSHGDTSAHDRYYITTQLDIDDIKSHYRRVINELLIIASIYSPPTPPPSP